MQEVEIQKGEADKIAEVISKEEAVVQVAVDEANAIKEECEKDLAEAMPILMGIFKFSKIQICFKYSKQPPYPPKTLICFLRQGLINL